MLSLLRTLLPLLALLLLATRLPSALGWSVATYATADCTGPTTSYKSGLALDECVPTSGGIYASSKIYCTPAKDQKITEVRHTRDRETRAAVEQHSAAACMQRAHTARRAETQWRERSIRAEWRGGTVRHAA